jgi:hypothetical protein
MSFGPRKQIPTLMLWGNLVRHLFIPFICVQNLILTNFSIKKFNMEVDFMFQILVYLNILL